MTEKDYEVKITIRNNYLLRLMRDRGIDNGLRLSELSGATSEQIYKMLSLKMTPFKEDGTLRSSVEKVCDFLNATPYEIFPPQHINTPLKNNVAFYEASLEEVARITNKAQSDPQKLIEQTEAKKAVAIAVSCLSARDADVIEKRFGLNGHQPMTLDEIGKEQGVTGNTIRIIEQRALMRLRHPRMSKHQLEHHKQAFDE